MPSLNLDLNYFDHVKAMRLVARLGPGADVLPIKLWAWVGNHHPETGRLALLESEVEHICHWWGDKGAMVSALLEIGFLKKVGNFFEINDWFEHSGHLAAFKKRAKKAARKRWGIKTKSSNASSNAKSEVEQSPCSAVQCSAVHDIAVQEKIIPQIERRGYRIPDPAKDPIGGIVMFYKALKKHIPFDDVAWDKQHWPRCAKAAKSLLTICETYEASKACIDELAEGMEEANRSWSLETVVRWAHEWKVKHAGRDYGATNSARFFDAVAKQRTDRKFEEFRKNSTDGEISNGARGYPRLQDHTETHNGGAREGDGSPVAPLQKERMETAANRGVGP